MTDEEFERELEEVRKDIMPSEVAESTAKLIEGLRDEVRALKRRVSEIESSLPDFG